MEKAKTVTVRLPEGQEGEEVLEIGYNGVMYLLRRGEEAELPVAVVAILRDAGLWEGEEA